MARQAAQPQDTRLTAPDQTQFEDRTMTDKIIKNGTDLRLGTLLDDQEGMG